MSEASRRGFLALAGTTAAVAGVAVAVPAASASEPTAAGTKAAKVHGPVIAYLSNAASGEVTILHGDRSVTVHDHDLAARVTGKLEKG